MISVLGRIVRRFLLHDLCLVMSILLRRKYLLFLLLVDLLLFLQVCSAQSGDTTATRQQALAQLEEFSLGEKLSRFKLKHYPETQGHITADLVIKGRKVETVFIVESTVEPMMFNNAFSNFLKDMDFDFKLPKGERQKIRYTFRFQAIKK